KRPIRSILRARCTANGKKHLAHDPTGREHCDMAQVDFRPACFLQKSRKKPAKRLQRSVVRRERGSNREQNGPGCQDRGGESDVDSKSPIGNIAFDVFEKR
ncbi:hypothetical protein WH47_00563, partial [Habropoda laboriosa]